MSRIFKPICIDLETTGVDPYFNSIVSIGAVDMDNLDNRFYTEFTPFPGAKIEEESMKIHGLTLDYLYSLRRTESQGINEFAIWLSEFDGLLRVAGYNVHFDYYFLKYSFDRNERFFPFDYHVLDLFPIFAGMKGYYSDLAGITRFLDLPENPKPHNALEDALITAKCLKELMGDKI